MAWQHFIMSEFACKHCSQVILLYLPDLAGVLERIREAVGGKPVIINSGYRCPTHNKAVGGAPASQHLAGKAADIRSSVGYAALAKAADQALGSRGAVLQYPKRNFVHVDIRPGKSRAVME